MPLSVYKYGSNTETDHNYSLHGFPTAENYANRPVRTFFDCAHMSVSENLNVKRVPLLWSIPKVKVVSFLMGLTLMFIIMASYILMWDKKGLLFTPSPDQFRPVVVLTSTATVADVSSDLIDMKLLVKLISSKLEYTSRTVPDVKDIMETDSHVSQ